RLLTLLFSCTCLSCFFFQAEDGIRDPLVTGVQTCALPISRAAGSTSAWVSGGSCRQGRTAPISSSRISSASERRRDADGKRSTRSEERRVGKECRSRWGT